jgi:hypothetical protein
VFSGVFGQCGQFGELVLLIWNRCWSRGLCPVQSWVSTLDCLQLSSAVILM